MFSERLHREFETLTWLILSLSQCCFSIFQSSKVYLRKQTWSHLAWIGTDSLPIVSIIASCTGIILALQAAIQLERFGALSYVANLVGVTIIMELGPLLTAIILTGRAGAAFTAEIATMSISDEVDALNVMGIDVVRYLVWPKFIAMLIMTPLLTAWADFIGIFSGGAFSAIVLGLSPQAYFEQTATFLKLTDFFSGIVKSLGFSATITLVGCWQGFLAREGASDVGKRTTKAVVQAIFLIIVLDLFFTWLSYLIR
ncbi:ABC transporter permease [Desulfovibrio inopinatus]|uniref:ABC transporter permease n=1 Tax=Desulfovibrio inopinatus TaxID=102109 RepID=UPI000428DF32|nr:ABC transporter permease [Desulfovibrio inopinatus]